MGADVDAQEELGLLHQPAGGAAHGIGGGGSVGQMVAIISHHIPGSYHCHPDRQAVGHVFDRLLGTKFPKFGNQLLFIVPACTHRGEANFSEFDGSRSKGSRSSMHITHESTGRPILLEAVSLCTTCSRSPVCCSVNEAIERLLLHPVQAVEEER